MRVRAFMTVLLPVIGLYAALLIGTLCIRSRRENERRRKSEQAKAMRAQQAEDRKREREAAKAAKAAEKAAAPKRKRGRPRKEAAAPADEPQQSETLTTGERLASLGIKGNNAFAGQRVAFTGELEGMTRAEAIRLVQDNGGEAYDSMPAGTTLLVIADKLTRSGGTTGKLEKADRWAGQVRKISEGAFKAKLTASLVLSPDQFAALIDR